MMVNLAVGCHALMFARTRAPRCSSALARRDPWIAVGSAERACRMCAVSTAWVDICTTYPLAIWENGCSGNNLWDSYLRSAGVAHDAGV